MIRKYIFICLSKKFMTLSLKFYGVRRSKLVRIRRTVGVNECFPRRFTGIAP